MSENNTEPNADSVGKQAKHVGQFWLDFAKKHKGEIAVVGTTYLFLKQGVIRKDVKNIADTVHHLTKGMQALVEHGENTTRSIEDLYKHVDEFYGRTDDLYRYQGGQDELFQEQAQQIEELQRTKQDLFTQFFGERPGSKQQ